MRFSHCVGATFVVALALVAPASAQSYAVTNLGSLPGHADATVTGINNLGQIVGLSGGYAFRTSPGQTIATAQILGAATSATAIDDSGRVVVNAVNKVYLTTATGDLTTATDLTLNQFGSFLGTASNNNGMVVGMADFGTGQGYAWRWTSSAGIEYLSSGDAYPPVSIRPTSVNASGQIGGWTSPSATTRRAFLTRPGQLTYVANSAPMGTINDYVSDVNDSGRIVGGRWWQGPYSSESDSVFFDGTTSTSVYHWSGVRALNNNDMVVGSRNEFGFAWVWTRSGGHQFLSSVTTNAQGWSFDTVSGINDAGQIIGSGTHNGQYATFLLTPTSTATPEPASAALLILLGVPVAMRESRRRRTDSRQMD